MVLLVCVVIYLIAFIIGYIIYRRNKKSYTPNIKTENGVYIYLTECQYFDKTESKWQNAVIYREKDNNNFYVFTRNNI